MQNIKLNSPIVFGSDTIEELNMREPTLGDLDGINLEEMGKTENLVVLLARISGVSVSALKKMSLRDLIPISKAIAVFFPSESLDPELQDQT